MYVDVPEYLVPKLKNAARHLNISLSELVCDALVSYVQDLEDAEEIGSSKTHRNIKCSEASYHKRKIDKNLKNKDLVLDRDNTNENSSL